ncbi:MAG: helix-turn-helix domain-containing protein [Chitinophagaceae bacterium]|jgi:antitoxin component HigA of HigAB toxin-antitoxin module|nr:MAG: helix-turn-helix domain-containing protein [Chitinophagaceae bacterium]
MKKITTEKAYIKALNDVNRLMSKGEENLTNKDAKDITLTAKAIQEYEKIHYPFPTPKTITEMIELKMFEKKLNRVTLSKKLGIGNPKLSQILNGKREPDVKFLKAIHKTLGVDGNFILENV